MVCSVALRRTEAISEQVSARASPCPARIQENVGRRACDRDTCPAQLFWPQQYPCSARSFLRLGPLSRERHVHQTKRQHASTTYGAASATSRPSPRSKAPNGPAASLRASGGGERGGEFEPRRAHLRTTNWSSTVSASAPRARSVWTSYYTSSAASAERICCGQS